MTFQRLLLRFWTLPILRRAGQALLKRRVWTVEAGAGAGLKMQFPQNREFITGTSEPPVQRELARRLKPGDVFYDIGANVGFFSLVAGRSVGAKGCVCAFEPNPQNVAAVRGNARLNGLDNVRVFDVAVGCASRREEFLITEWDGGGTLVQSGIGPSARISRMDVQVEPLDTLIAARRLPEPTLVKIDVEGAELEVIEGMAETIARCRPTLLYEIDDAEAGRFKRRWEDLDERVRELGYEVTHLEDSYPAMNWNVGHSLAFPGK